MVYLKSEPYNDCAGVTIRMETDDSTAPKAADNELADIDDNDDNDAMRVKPVSECVTPGVLDQQQHDTGDCDILFFIR